MSFNQVVTSETERRLLLRAYPGQATPPKSTSTVRIHLEEEATKFCYEIRTMLEGIRLKGMFFSHLSPYDIDSVFLNESLRTLADWLSFQATN